MYSSMDSQTLCSFWAGRRTTDARTPVAFLSDCIGIWERGIPPFTFCTTRWTPIFSTICRSTPKYSTSPRSPPLHGFVYPRLLESGYLSSFVAPQGPLPHMFTLPLGLPNPPGSHLFFSQFFLCGPRLLSRPFILVGVSFRCPQTLSNFRQHGTFCRSSLSPTDSEPFCTSLYDVTQVPFGGHFHPSLSFTPPCLCSSK